MEVFSALFTMDNIRHLHKDRPAIAMKVSRAFEILLDESETLRVPRQSLLEALLTILEYCGDYHGQSSVLKIIFSKEDVTTHYKYWFAKLWFGDMPNTMKAFIDLQVSDAEDFCYFLFLYNSELDLRFVYSVSCFLVSWNNSRLQNPKKGGFWLHLNCGTKTLSVTGVDRIPVEVDLRGVFVLRSSEIRSVEIYNQVTPYGAKIQGLSICTSKGTLVVHPDPAILNCEVFSNFIKFICKVNVEFKTLVPAWVPAQVEYDCNGNLISDSCWNNQNSKLEESDPASAIRLGQNSVFHVSSSQDGAVGNSTHMDEDEIAVQICNESDNTDIEVCEHIKRSPSGSCHGSDESVNDLNISTNLDTCVNPPSGTIANSMLASQSNVILAAASTFDANSTEKPSSNLIIPEGKCSSINSETLVSGTITAEENALDKEGIGHSIPLAIEHAAELMPLGKDSIKASGNKPTRKWKAGKKPSTNLSGTARKTARGCRLKLKQLSSEQETEKVPRDTPVEEGSSTETIKTKTIKGTPSRRATRSFIKRLQELSSPEEPEFKSPLEKPRVSVSRTRMPKPPVARKRRSSASIGEATGSLENCLPATLLKIKNAKICEPLQNNLQKSPKLEESGDSANVTNEDTGLQLKDSAIQRADLPTTYPLSMPSLTTPIATPSRGPDDIAYQADFVHVHDEMNMEFKSAICDPAPAVQLYPNSETVLLDRHGFHTESLGKSQRFDEEYASQGGNWKVHAAHYNSCEAVALHLDSSSDASFFEGSSAVLMPMNDPRDLNMDVAKFTPEKGNNKLQQFSEICSHVSADR